MASMLMYARLMAHEHAGAAIKAYYQGDKQGMLAQLQQANSFVPNGQNYYASDNKNGTFHVENRNGDNSVLNWEADVAPQQILAAALQVYDGSAFWKEMEQVAYKYDPVSKAMVDQRTQATNAQQINAAAPPYGPGSAPVPGGPPAAAPAAPPAAPPAATINSSSPIPIPPAMGGVNDLRRQLAAPTGIGNPPGSPPPPPQAPGAAQATVSSLTPPQVADAGAGPGAMPPTYGQSDLGGPPPPDVPLEAPPRSPVPTRTDTTTAQPATPPAGADNRAPLPQTPPPLPERETIADVTPAPRTDEELAHQAKTIHDQVFSPQGGHFLPGGVYRMADGTTYAPPPRYQMTGNPKSDAEIDKRQREADQLYHQAGIAAGQQAADDERQQVADLKAGQQAQNVVFRGKQQVLMENQRENARQAAAALVEANKTQGAAEAERVRLGHEHEAPIADEYDMVKAGVPMGKIPVAQAAPPHVDTMFAKPFNPSGLDGMAKPASAFITSDESKAALPSLTGMIYRYNAKNGMTLPQAADTLRLLVSNPEPLKKSDITIASSPGDPSDIRVTLPVKDDRGVVHTVGIPKEAFIELSGVRAEFAANAAKTKETDLKADELNKRKGSAMSGILGTVGGALSAVAPRPGETPPPRPQQPPTAPMISPLPSRPGTFQLPQRVPNAQVPPEWKQQFPELNQ